MSENKNIGNIQFTNKSKTDLQKMSQSTSNAEKIGVNNVSVFEGKASGKENSEIAVHTKDNKEIDKKILKLIEQNGLNRENIQSARSVNMKNNEIGIAITYKPDENGAVKTLIFRDGSNTLGQQIIVDKKQTETTMYYDSLGEDVLFNKVKSGSKTTVSDALGRIISKEILRGNGLNENTRYIYKDDTNELSKIIKKLVDGSVVIEGNGKKTTSKPDGSITIENISDDENSKKLIIKPFESVEKFSKSDKSELEKQTKFLNGLNELLNKSGNVKKSAKIIASYLQKLIYSAGSAPDAQQRADGLKQYISKKINSSNVDYVLYEYKQLTGRNLFEDIEAKLSNFKDISIEIKRNLAETQYKKYGVNLDYKNQNSVVSNKHRKGDAYSVQQNGTVMTITNKKTGQTRTIDLDELLQYYPNARERASIIKQLQSLPGEVLMDIAIEADPFVPLKKGTVVNTQGGGQCEAAGFYRPNDDSIHLQHDGRTSTLVHEMGHAVDYNGYIKNTSSVMNDKNFKKIFNAEMQNYIAAGNKRYVFESDGKSNSPRSTYATANEKEMFAECYTLLMTGKCGSQKIIERYFPQTLAYINQKLDELRDMNDIRRHKQNFWDMF